MDGRCRVPAVVARRLVQPLDHASDVDHHLRMRRQRGRESWVMEWPAYALAHGLDPFYSTALGHPTGINLLANAGIVAFGFLLTPVTWAFGPVASLNVALTLSPALSAMAMYVLLRRWVTWTPAAFAGGLVYGFSPIVLVSLTATAINLAMAAVPPLVVACLDEIVVSQGRRPVRIGILLGLLLTLQFFIGTEVLLLTVVLGAGMLVLLIVVTAVHDLDAVRSRVDGALVGLGAVFVYRDPPACDSGLVCPLRPRHYTGAYLARGTACRPAGQRECRSRSLRLGLAGDRAPAKDMSALACIRRLPGSRVSWQYLGFGALVVVLGGLVVWRRRPPALVLRCARSRLDRGLAPARRTPPSRRGPSRNGLPLLENVVPYHIVLFVFLAVAVLVGLIVDHTYRSLLTMRVSSEARDGASRSLGGDSPRRVMVVGVVGLLVAAIALVPPALAVAETIPVTTRPAVLPTWSGQPPTISPATRCCSSCPPGNRCRRRRSLLRSHGRQWTGWASPS